MALEELWVEKYRPSKIEDYVFPDAHIEALVTDIVKTGNLPHLLLTGQAGTGKTTLALVLKTALLESDIDFLKLNASDENSVDVVRGIIKSFVSTWAMGNFKIVLLDEFDYASPHMQAGLRQMMEEHSNTCRFIMTGNFPNKIINAIKSRSSHIHFPKPDVDDMMVACAEILVAEEIDIPDIDVLDTLVRMAYPDLRKAINLIQEYSIDGVLTSPASSSDDVAGWQAEMIQAIKKSDFTKVYDIITKHVALDGYDDLYTFLGNNTDGQKLIYVADFMYKHALVCDADVNMKALCTKLDGVK